MGRRGQGGQVSVGLMSGEIFKFYSRQRSGFMLVLSIKMQCLLFTAKLPSGGRILAERWSDRISRGEKRKREKSNFPRASGTRGMRRLSDCNDDDAGTTECFSSPIQQERKHDSMDDDDE